MRDRIIVDPNIHFGKPCVAGTRIPVQDVLELVREGLSFADIIRDYYTDLELEDVFQRALCPLDLRTEHRFLPNVHRNEQVGVRKNRRNSI